MVCGGVVDAQRAGAGDAGLAHAARHHGRMRGHAAARGEDALGRVHAVDVLGARLDAHENDLACPCALSFSASSAENTISPEAAPGEAGRPVAITLRSAPGSMVGCRSWSSAAGSMRVTASSREIRPSFASSTAILQRGLGGALARARLQHPQLALLDREFEILHVAIVALEHAVDARQLARTPPASPVPSTACRSPPPRRAASVISCGVRMPATTSSPWALIRNSP